MNNNFIATNEFQSSLDVTGEVATSLSEPEALTPSQLPITNSISCACVVLMSGYFECFLKDIIKEYVDSINGLRKPILEIPLNMQLKHYSGGAEALAIASKKDKSLRTTTISQDLAQRLGSLNLAVGYTLAWESFANTKSNPSTEVVSMLLSGLEVDRVWDNINGLQTRHGRLDTFLLSFMEIRNICAHTGRHSTPPSGADIVDYVEKFRSLSECIDMLLGLRLEAFK